MRVLLVGDTHGDRQFVSNVNRLAKTQRAQYVIQLGDFGYSFPEAVLTSIRTWLDADERRKWLWLDGNHDQHDYIRSEICKGKHPKKPVAHFHDRMYYCPRGSTLRIGKKKVLFLGGAVSVDKARRTQGENWWPQESINTADVYRAIDNGKGADVLLSHDCPESLDIKRWLRSNGYKSDRDSRQNRMAISAVVEELDIPEVYHGHYHHRYTAHYGNTLIEGLGANYARGEHSPKATLDHNCLLLDW